MHWETIVVRAAIPAGVVALVAGIVSYMHIADLALSTGQGWSAYLLPFAVDGLIVAGTVILLAGSQLGWLCVAPGMAATIYANVMSGLPRGPLAATVAAWPAAAFALASFTLERWLKSRAKPGEATGAACGHEVALTNDEAVVTAFLHGRDCVGYAPSQRHLSSAFNVSRPRVAELVGPLNGHPAAADSSTGQIGELWSIHGRKSGRIRVAHPGNHAHAQKVRKALRVPTEAGYGNAAEQGQTARSPERQGGDSSTRQGDRGFHPVPKFSAALQARTVVAGRES